MPCSSADLNGLSPADLVAFLQSQSFDCVRESAWTLDANLQSVLSTAHLSAVLQEITTVSPAYQGTVDPDHLASMLQFVHAAYYHWNYNKTGWAFFDPVTVTPDLFAALDAFIASPGANVLHQTAGQILYEWTAAVDGAEVADRYYTDLIGLLQTFAADPLRQADQGQRTNTWVIFHVINRAVVLIPAFVAKVDQALIDEVRAIALLQNLVPSATYLVNKAVFTLGGICGIPAWKQAAVDAITDVKVAYPNLSEPYLWAIDALGCNACVDANGNTLCKSDVAPLLEAQLLPNSWTFDDGSITIRTPLALNDVQPLYHAIKQVEAQFNRLTETIAPLPGDPNGKLKVILYGSRADYTTYNGWLYGLDTNNGGIYIEDTGTFYTYQRTAQESIYTLEELFRHEYVHYVVGRFLIGGLWGQAPIYAADRMVWFDEGLAEFLTWSTARTVKVRQRLVQQISNDGPNGRMTVNAVCSATYGDPIFYRYAALLFAYWYQHDLETLKELIALARAGDVIGWDAKVAALRADAALETAYQLFLDGQVAGVNGLDNPQTSFPPVGALDEDDPVNIQALVRATRLGYLAEASVSAVQQNTRFSCRGYLSGTLSNQADATAAWETFDSGLNEMIDELAAGPPNNFQGLVGRFGRVHFIDYSGQVYPQADYFLEGPLAPGAGAVPQTNAQVLMDFNATRLGKNAVCTQVSPNVVECTLHLTTGLYPSATADAVLQAELTNSLDELRNQVYAIRPPYYRALECQFSGSAQVVSYSLQQKYLLRPVLCRVTFT